MKITAKSIAALTLPEGKSDSIHFDDDLPGFGYRLRRGAGGNVNTSWVAQYRRAGATRRALLGAGAVLSAEQARNAAKQVLAKVALGEDPQADKAERRDKDRLSLRSVIDEYLASRRARCGRAAARSDPLSHRTLLQAAARHGGGQHHPQGRSQPSRRDAAPA